MHVLGLLGEGWLLGVALSPACLGVCLPLMVPFFSAEQRTALANWKALLFFFAGRLAGYALMGLGAGWLGQDYFNRGQATGWVEGLVFLLMGLLLTAYALLNSFPQWSFCVFLHRNLLQDRTPFILGLLTGINICPPFLAVLLEAARTQGPLEGALVLVAFFLGTSLILLPLPMIGILAKESALRLTGRVAAGVVGIWFFIRGVFTLLSG
ncbi:sulfite exporter TauE/SafE family protein [candidate division FCPU426 bacterium]|nr:sulfite exporter TauE/SafE family protein [candidate division FCPU426 bacterium]